MENLPQNENNTSEEFSTIFSDPAAHNEKAKTGKNKRLLKALSLLLVVAIIIGGTFAIVKFIPEKQEEDTTSDTIEILDYGDFDIKEMTLKNKNGTFNIYSKVVEADDETTGETVTETFWYLKGYDTDLTDSAALQTIVETAVNMDAIRVIDSKTAKDCGLENPVVSANVTPIEGDKFTVDVGSKSPDNAGVYVKVSNSDSIYLVGSMLDEELNFADIDVASTDAQTPLTLNSKKYAEYLSDETIIGFDTITVSGNNLPEDIVLTLSNDEKLKGFIPYYLTSPMKRAGENGDAILSIFSQGFPVTGAYSYDVEGSTIKKFGLDNPDFTVSIKFKDYTYSYKFKKQKDGYYAFVGNNSKNVKKVSEDDCAFLNYTTYDFYNKIVYITPINMVSNLIINTADGNYDFSIASSSNSEDETTEYIVECDGKTYNSTYFQSFYQFLSSLECMDFEVEKTSGKPDLTMTYVYNNKSNKPTVIEFYKINATKYQYSVDGVAMGRIGSTSYNKIHKNLERLLAGKQIVIN